MRAMKKSRLRLKTEGNKSNHDISQNGVERKNDFPTVELVVDFMETKIARAVANMHDRKMASR